jgi:choice-of-anchor B domain-containing protein
LKGRLLATVLIVASLSALLPGHDSLDSQAPFPAPRFSLNGGGSAGFTSSGISLLSWIPVTDFDPTFTGANDCWGYASPSGREYALIGATQGICFVEITDPGAPVIVGVFGSVDSLWHDIKTYQDHAYAVSEGANGIQVFDMSLIDSGTVTELPTVTTGGCTNASHNVAIDTDSGFLYRLGGSGSPCSGGPQGVVAYDLSNPAAPSFVGAWNDRYVHDAQFLTWDVAGPFFGREIALLAANNTSGGGTPSLVILDVTNKGSMSVIGQVAYPSSAFSHQCWITDDRQFVYLNDELDERNFGGSTNSRVIDISDLTSPFQTATFTTGVGSIDHNMYVSGDLIFEANYRSGLRVFDTSNQTAPVEVAFFDTYPEDDNPEFNSLWSSYPFFPSGTIIGSDMEKGLFVWRMGDPQITFSYPGGLPPLVDPAGGTPLQVQLAEDTIGDLDLATVELQVDTGSGFAPVPLTPLGGLLYEAVFPASNCGDTVRYYMTARSNDGATWTDPCAGPTQVHTATSALQITVAFLDELEVNSGWTAGVGGDTAATGIWTRGDPIGTAAQPESDHTEAPGTDCFVTGQGTPGGSVGENDVDDGTTTLLSPTLDATGLADPTITYWRWFSNNQGSAAGEDVLMVDISNNNGASWVSLEIVGPTGPDTTGGWIRHMARISDFVTPTNQIRLRFETGDLFNGSIVEAAIDDLSIDDLVCTSPLALNTVSPASGSFRGGNTVILTGDGFAGGATVEIGGSASPSVNVISNSVIEAEVPQSPRNSKRAAVSATVDVSVTTSAGTASLPDAYSYTVEVGSAN